MNEQKLPKISPKKAKVGNIKYIDLPKFITRKKYISKSPDRLERMAMTSKTFYS